MTTEEILSELETLMTVQRDRINRGLAKEQETNWLDHSLTAIVVSQRELLQAYNSIQESTLAREMLEGASQSLTELVGGMGSHHDSRNDASDVLQQYMDSLRKS